MRKGRSVAWDQSGYQRRYGGNDGIGNWADWTLGLRHLGETKKPLGFTATTQ
ncbi:unnamed protein product [Sphenostylis stenocarpa]|uniref:Uncharacterized protein n=1 Tax=Sphenostylis stenocarpa TaxID=92480 RepID=A0AA86W0H3_9FABA|nr:unnamed protein product [Sphenostylis stenocarpa]